MCTTTANCNSPSLRECRLQNSPPCASFSRLNPPSCARKQRAFCCWLQQLRGRGIEGEKLPQPAAQGRSSSMEQRRERSSRKPATDQSRSKRMREIIWGQMSRDQVPDGVVATPKTASSCHRRSSGSWIRCRNLAFPFSLFPFARSGANATLASAESRLVRVYVLAMLAGDH